MVVGGRIFYCLLCFFYFERRRKKLVEEEFLLNGLNELAVSAPHVSRAALQLRLYRFERESWGMEAEGFLSSQIVLV